MPEARRCDLRRRLWDGRDRLLGLGKVPYGWARMAFRGVGEANEGVMTHEEQLARALSSKHG